MKSIGIDIGKTTFVTGFHTEKKSCVKTFQNDEVGYSKLINWINSFDLSKCHYCMESTGKYGVALARYLYDHQYAISIVNPFRIKHFAKSCMQRNKTDALDALTIAEFCQVHQPSLWSPLPENILKLQSLSNRLSQVEALKMQEINRLECETDEVILKSIRKMIEGCDKQIASLETSLQTLIENDHPLAQKARLMQSICGVGNKISWAMLLLLGQEGRFQSAKQLCAYIGINPSQRQSGTSLNQSSISRMGNAKFRKILYMPTLCAITHNPIIRKFYQRLVANGKPKMVAVIAAMKKLVFLIFGVVKNKIPFDPNYQK